MHTSTCSAAGTRLEKDMYEYRAQEFTLEMSNVMIRVFRDMLATLPASHFIYPSGRNTGHPSKPVRPGNCTSRGVGRPQIPAQCA